MNEKTLRVLEYDKIIKLVADETVSNLGREIAMALKPSNNIYEIKEWLQETTEAVDIILKVLFHWKAYTILEGVKS